MPLKLCGRRPAIASKLVGEFFWWYQAFSMMRQSLLKNGRIPFFRGYKYQALYFFFEEPKIRHF
jgi:hypothetical protein